MVVQQESYSLRPPYWEIAVRDPKGQDDTVPESPLFYTGTIAQDRGETKDSIPTKVGRQLGSF
jgi:hypothetical protein